MPGRDPASTVKLAPVQLPCRDFRLTHFDYWRRDDDDRRTGFDYSRRHNELATVVPAVLIVSASGKDASGGREEADKTGE
jgi:hypothetical protein